MTNYFTGSKPTQSTNVLEAKEKRKKLLEAVRKRRASMQKKFQEKLKKHQANEEFI